MSLKEATDEKLKIIRDFYSSLENYELEVALTDVLIIYNTEIKKKFEVKKLYITQPVRDYEIDAIVQDNNDIIYIYQISKSRKTRGKLGKFMNDSTIDMCTNLLDTNKYYRQIDRNIITLEKSSNIEGAEVISSDVLFEIIYKVWKYIGINDENRNEYKENIEIRSAFWERINVHRKKGKLNLVESYLKVMLSNHYSIIKGHFGLLKSIENIENFNFNGLLTLSTTMTEQEKIKNMILFRSKIVYDGDFNEIYMDVENLVSYIVELTKNNLDKYLIVPRCRYISIKDKSSSEVIAYYPYKYRQKGVYSSHAFGYKCTKRDLDNKGIIYSKIQESKGDIMTVNIDGSAKQIKHGCSFKTPIYFVEPNLNLESDLKILKDMFELSKSIINKVT